MILNTARASDDNAVSGLHKAAMLLIVLGEQSSAELLQQLSEDDVQKVSREVDVYKRQRQSRRPRSPG